MKIFAKGTKTKFDFKNCLAPIIATLKRTRVFIPTNQNYSTIKQKDCCNYFIALVVFFPVGDFNPSGRKFFKVIIPYFQMIDMTSISFNAESMDARSRKLICVCLISITLVSLTLVSETATNYIRNKENIKTTVFCFLILFILCILGVSPSLVSRWRESYTAGRIMTKG